MEDTVDHLQRAKAHLAYVARSDEMREDTRAASAMALLSIAYSLVALTEQLDKVTTTERPALRVLGLTHEDY